MKWVLGGLILATFVTETVRTIMRARADPDMWHE